MVQVIVMNKSYRVIGLSERAIRELTYVLFILMQIFSCISIMVLHMSM
jgi:hypothetical protein